MGRTTRMVVTGARAIAALFVVTGAWSLYLASSSASASASTLNGTATISDPSNPTVALTSGGSTTAFTVTLPADAACTGDTATDGYHVFSYLVEKGTTITGITFTSHPSVGIGLVNNAGTYYGPANTALGTGQIISIPSNFEWGPLVTVDHVALSTLLYSGTSGVWETGLACADSSGTLSDYWNAEVTFTASGSDPAGFVWGTGSTTTTTTTTTNPGGSTTTTTTNPGGSTTTTTTTTIPDNGSTTTTTIPGNGSTTTTTVPGNGTTTTVAGATSSGSSGSSGSDGSSGTASVGDATAASSGSLAFTGGSMVRDVALGLLCIGIGLILLGMSVKWRREGDLWRGAAVR